MATWDDLDGAPAPAQRGAAPAQSGWDSLDSAPAPRAQVSQPARGGWDSLDDEALPSSGTAPVSNSTDDEGGGWMGPALAGGALLAGGAALAARSGGKVGAIGKGLMALRSQAMLSGLAPLKSALGNVGAAGVASIERGSAKPLKEVLSMQTLKDAVAAYRRGTPPGAASGNQVTLKNPFTGKEMHTPGRFMGALDEATQAALQRGGLSADDAAREVLQTPLGKNYGAFGDALDSPAMQYLIPFRRTPFNQLAEGAKAIKAGTVGGDSAARRALSVYGGAGAAHGAATSEDDMPLSIPMAIAASGRYGLPYGLAALAGRGLMGGDDGKIGGNLLPVSEYGFTQGIQEPGAPFGLSLEKGFDPADLAPIRALEKLIGGG